MNPYTLDKKQLIVVLPGCLVTDVGLANKAKTSAQQVNAQVLYLVLADSPAEMMALPKKMKTMEAITKGTWVIITAEIEDIPCWQKGLQKFYHSDDLMLLASEQNLRTGQLIPVRVVDFLCNPLKVPRQAVSIQPRQIHLKHKSVGARFLIWIGYLVFVGISSVVEKEDYLRLNYLILQHISHL